MLHVVHGRRGLVEEYDIVRRLDQSL
jgi:hypothetical protein